MSCLNGCSIRLVEMIFNLDEEVFKCCSNPHTCPFLFSPTTHRSSVPFLGLPKHSPAGRTSSHPRGLSAGLWSPRKDQPQCRPCLHLQALWSGVPPAQLAAAALRPVPAKAPAVLSAARDGKQEDQAAAVPAGLQPLLLHCVQSRVQPHGKPEDSPSHPHRREAVHVLGVLQVFPALWRINQALPHPYWRKAIHLWSMWEVF